MSESERLHKEADHLSELADTLQRTTEEVRKVLFEQTRTLRFNADLQWHSEQRIKGRSE